MARLESEMHQHRLSEGSVHANGDTLIQLQTGISPDAEAVIRLAGIHTPEASWFAL